MTPERWRQIEDLCHAALTRPAEEHAAFLASACAGDAVLLREVESLLAQASHAAGFMSAPAAAVAGAAVLNHADGTLVGQRLGSYTIRSLLGVGGMGEVYRAHDNTLGREVAIKVLPPAFTGDPDRRARFEREARMLATLNHPHIGAIYGLEEADGIRALVLELVEGETLSERLARSPDRPLQANGRDRPSGRPIPLAEALAIARQIADALDAAHEKGIVHRDLKPANIMITQQGLVKVLDFGLAKPASPDSSRPDLTESREGVILGTAAYMSPEQARGHSVDKRGDIWAFGCVLYEMLTGRLAFPGETASDTIARILEREPDWSALPAATPPSIRRLLRRCLTKDPKQRLRDIGEVGIEIDAIGQGPLAPSDRPVAPRRWRTALGVGVVVLSLLAAVASWLTRSAAPPPIENLLSHATFTPVTDWEGSEQDAAISPDGRFIAFMSDRDGPFHAFLRQVGVEDIRDLTPNMPDQRNAGPTRHVGFSADGDIWINGTLGRRMRRLSLLDNAPSDFLSEHAVNVAWSRDGKRLAYFTFDAGDPLFTADGTGGYSRPIWESGKGEHNHFPAWSADGQWIYYAHGKTQPEVEFDIYRIPSSGKGKPERLTQLNTDVRYLTAIDARTVLYVAPDEDRSGPWLWALDVERRVPPRRVSAGLERYLSVAASADGHRLVATVAKSTASLWSVPILDRNRVADERRDVTHYPLTGTALAPRFGGAALFYLSSSGQGYGLWRFQDGKPVEIWKGSNGVLSEPAAISSNGNRMAVALRTQGRGRLTLVSADGRYDSLAEGIDIRGAAAWSPNDKWIVTGGNDAQGPGLFMIPVDGGEPVRLVSGPASDPVWSPKEDLIIYTSQQGANAPLLAVRPDGSPLKIPEIRVPFGGGGRARFLSDGKLLYLKGAVGTQDFWLLDMVTGKSRQITRLSNSATIFAFDITPDGRHIVFDRIRENSDIRLIDLPKE